jgi:hypothetical protein
MGKLWLAALGLVVAAILLLLVRDLRSGGDRVAPAAPAADREPSPAPAPAPPPAPPPRTETASASPALPPEPASLAPIEPGDIDPRLEHRVRTVPRTLMNAAADCYRDQPGDSDQRVEFKYTLTYDGGAARVSDIVVTSSTLGDLALEQCIVETVGALRWDEPEMPNLEARLDSSISLHDLRRRQWTPPDD